MASSARAGLVLMSMVASCARTSPPGPPPNASAPGPERPLAAPAPRSVADEPGARGLDAWLSGYDYPYPVHYFELTAQEQRLRMAYMTAGPSAGPVVLLLHGKNFSGAYWGPTMRALVDAGYRVIVPDQIGFGKSSKPVDYQYSFQALARHTRALLAQEGVERCFVVGHSMGGMLAVRFALMYPEQTRGLVLLNPIGLEDYKRVVPYRSVDEWTERLVQQKPEQVRQYMTESYFDGQWKAEYAPLVELQEGWIQGPDWPRLARVSALTFDMIFTQPVVYELGDLSAPALLVIGQRDRTAIGKDAVPAAVAAKLGDYPALGKRAAAAIPGARLVELPGVGHLPQYEAPGETVAALLEFLSAHSGAPSAPGG